MEFNIGDTVRIISDPNTLLFEGGDYEIGDIATIEAIEFNNGRIWYELDVELFDSDQALWCEKNLELVKVADTTSKYRPGDEVVLSTEAGQPTKTIGFVRLESVPGKGEQYIYYMSKAGGPDLYKGYAESILSTETKYTLF